MKIVDYIIVSAEVGSPQKLSRNVADKLVEGYEPLGSPFPIVVNPTSTQIFQAMVKLEMTVDQALDHVISHVTDD